jgi:hypothetical protein
MSRSASGVRPNLLYNGNFEQAPSILTAGTNTASRWVDGTAAGSQANRGLGWAIPGGGLNTTVAVAFDNTIARSGTYSLKLSLSDSSAVVTVGSYRTNAVTAASLPELFALKAATAYILTGYIRLNNVATNGAYIDLREMSSSGGTLATTSTNKLSGTNTGWQQVTLTLTTNASTVFGGVLMRNNVSGNISDAWFDDITLIQAPIGRNAAGARTAAGARSGA